MERRRSVFSFLVGLGVTVFFAVGVNNLLVEALPFSVTLGVAVALGFFVRECIQKDLPMSQRLLWSVGTGLVVGVVYFLIQLPGGGS